LEKDQDINDQSPVPENTSSENSASTNKVDETIIPLAPVSENIELEATDTPPLHPKNMEIHHHGHVHEQKKWKEYLFLSELFIRLKNCFSTLRLIPNRYQDKHFIQEK